MDNPRDLRRYTTLPVLIDMLVRKRLTFLSYDHWVDANDRKALEVYRRTLNYGFVGAICLTRAAETFHHWQVFAGGTGGVCVVFDRVAFEQLFSNRPHFLAGPVEYVKLSDIEQISAEDIHRLPFLKRWGFRHEEEYRVVGYAVPKCPAMEMELPRQLVRRILFSPFVHPSLVQSASVAIRSIDGWSDVKVGHSRLTDNEAWQSALAAFPERHGIIYGPWMDTPIVFEEPQ
jgi:hypothetical protein